MASAKIFLKAINEVRKESGAKDLGRISAPKGKYSLFYALELTRNYHLVDQGVTRKKFRYLEKMENKQREQALELMGKTGIDGTGRSFGVEHLEGVQAFWDKEYPDMFRIVAFDTKRGLKPVFKSENVRKYEVCVISDNGHWDGMKSVSRFFGLNYYCVSCEVVYDRPERHRIECRERCKNCCRMGFGYPCKKDSGTDLHCDICNKDFYNEGCFEEHKKKACRIYHKCRKCGEPFRTDRKHVCGEKFCKFCGTSHPGRQCHIPIIKQNNRLPKYRIVAYDMETAASEEREHIPNLISAAHTCTDCCEEKNKECDICVPGPRLITWSAADGIDPLSEFIDWILGFKNADTIAFAQYGGRYDSHFVLTGLAEKGYAPEVSMADLKIYQIQMGKLYIRDFWMLSQNKLADLPKTLELGIPAKLYFPHKYNKNENFEKKLSHLPPFEDYCPGTMTEEGYGKFAAWYEENKNTEFELGQQLKVYCENDVEILMAAILKFRRLFLDITKDGQTPQGFDILKHNMTIASAVMSVFRAKFLKGRHIPIIPEGGFEKAENQSKIAVKYFEWLSYRDGVKVRHAGNGGEVEFGGMKVDCVIGAQKKIIEFQGCVFHGCPRCYRPWTKGPDGKTMEEKLMRTEMKIESLRDLCKNFTVEEVWECDVRAQLKRDDKMKTFFANVLDKGPINPRDAYSGGRTMPFCLYAAASDEFEIAMFDIISLYPSVNYDTPYPVGIPKIVKRDEDVLWTEPEDVPYDGLLKVKVISPKTLMYPLLPVHVGGRLLFPLCGTCGKKEKKEFVLAKDEKKCAHNEDERALLGTFTSIELRKALELGYKVTHFYRAYHFEEFDNQLFKGYVRMFLKIKVEASGWPPEVNSEEEKKTFIEMYRAKYAICLDLKNIKKNPGLRLIAKLGLNSLWGKFSMRNNLSENKIIKSADEWVKIMQDDRLLASEPIMLKDNKTMRVAFKKKVPFVKEHRVSNIILSLWTTSAARIKLYEYMEKVYKEEGCKLLYCDTDSLIFTHPRGVCPLKEGKFLGEMTREYADSEILEFVSGGPKQYSLKFKRKTDGRIWQKTKIRGITQNVNNKIDFDEFKNMVLGYKKGKKIKFFYEDKFGPKRDGRVISQDVPKNYEPVQQKGIIDINLNVLPFGYY